MPTCSLQRVPKHVLMAPFDLLALRGLAGVAEQLRPELVTSRVMLPATDVFTVNGRAPVLSAVLQILVLAGGDTVRKGLGSTVTLAGSSPTPSQPSGPPVAFTLTVKPAAGHALFGASSLVQVTLTPWEAVTAHMERAREERWCGGRQH